MTGRGASRYRKVQLESAPPPRVLLELLGRLEADLAQAARSLSARDIQGKARAVQRALAVLGELEAALDHEVAPELCRNLAGLYRYCSSRILLASVRLDPAPLAEVAAHLQPVREAFEEVVAAATPKP